MCMRVLNLCNIYTTHDLQKIIDNIEVYFIYTHSNYVKYMPLRMDVSSITPDNIQRIVDLNLFLSTGAINYFEKLTLLPFFVTNRGELFYNVSYINKTI